MINVIRKRYIESRIAEVDKDFLVHEETMASSEDLEYISNLLTNNYSKELPNPYNSIILYVTGLSNKFDLKRARSDTLGGSSPDREPCIAISHSTHF